MSENTENKISDAVFLGQPNHENRILDTFFQKGSVNALKRTILILFLKGFRKNPEINILDALFSRGVGKNTQNKNPDPVFVGVSAKILTTEFSMLILGGGAVKTLKTKSLLLFFLYSLS